MSEERKPKVDDVVIIGISKFHLGPDDVLAIICPEGWTPSQVHMFQQYYSHVFRELRIKALVFPHGINFHIVEKDDAEAAYAKTPHSPVHRGNPT